MEKLLSVFFVWNSMHCVHILVISRLWHQVMNVKVICPIPGHDNNRFLSHYVVFLGGQITFAVQKGGVQLSFIYVGLPPPPPLMNKLINEVKTSC